MKSTPKTKAWAAFSKYVRLRDALRTTGTTEYAKCYTCGTVHPINEMDAGHWIPRNRLATFMDERNVRAQCRGCNRFGGGRTVEYQEHLIDDYGPDILNDLTRQAQLHVKLREADWKALEAEYKRRVNVMLETESVGDWEGCFFREVCGIV